MKRLEQILKRCEAATPEPWKYDLFSYAIYCELIGNAGKRIIPSGEEDKFFIAHARTDLPLVTQALMKAVEAIKILQRYHCGDGSITREKVTETLGGTLAEIEKMLGKE